MAFASNLARLCSCYYGAAGASTGLVPGRLAAADLLLLRLLLQVCYQVGRYLGHLRLHLCQLFVELGKFFHQIYRSRC